MNKRKIQKLQNTLIKEDDFFVEKDFIIKNTNYKSCVEFYNSLGVYTLYDQIKMASNPNIDTLVAQNSKFKNFNEFNDAMIDFLKADLPDFYKDIL